MSSDGMNWIANYIWGIHADLDGFSPNVQDILDNLTSSSATRSRGCPAPTPWAP